MGVEKALKAPFFGAMFELDHIAVACTDLAAGTAAVEAALGVKMQPGGQHERYGTHNTLLGLGDVYLEVIARDPAATPTRPTWFGLDEFDGPPRLANWICRTDDFADHARVTGPAHALTRGDLAWQITVPDDGSLPFDGAFPTLLQWAPGTRHPATRLDDSGLRLRRFTVSHPGADVLRDIIPIADPRVEFVSGDKGFRAVFDGPNGAVTLS